VDFPNDDPIFHNVFSLSSAATFDLRRYPLGQSRSQTFAKASIVKVYCNIHSHMSATILVMDNPYFATPALDGTFELPNIPPGEYNADRLARSGGRTAIDRPGGTRQDGDDRPHAAGRGSAMIAGAPASTPRSRRPPNLVVKTLDVTFAMVVVLLAIVFVVVSMSIGEQVRQTVTANLESSQRMFGVLEARRQRDLLAQAPTLAENPTLKAALDTYQAEAQTSSDAVKSQLFATIDGELRKLAAGVESDAVVPVDLRQNTLAAAGRLGERFTRGRAVALPNSREGNFDGVARVAGGVFRVVAVPLQFGDGATVGALYLATSLDAGYVEELARLAGTKTAIVSDGDAAYTGAIRALATALDARDPYTAGHSERVSVLSVAIGRLLALSPDDLEVLRLGALLHDIGKIGVPDDVLRKPSGLTAAEFDAIKQHPVLGARILRSVRFLAPHIPIVELHHERPDGKGYPVGLRGDEIPLAARIVHVADAYDAMTSARAYRGARPSGEEITVSVPEGRAMTMAGGEGEWAFSGTKVSGEVLRTAFDRIAGTAVAYEWFFQGQQTLSPRWFVAARREGTSAPPLVNGIVTGSRTDLDVFEATAGFRATPSVTLRSSYYTRRFYGATTWVNQVGFSAVWSQRWW
jgi:putative nucleotidyltransferase with HDIG domain